MLETAAAKRVLMATLLAKSWSPYLALNRVCNVIQVHSPFVREVVENVHGLFCSLSLLFEAEDEVQPLVQMAAHVLAFERLPLQSHKFMGASMSPGWKLHIIQKATVLHTFGKEALELGGLDP